jgi:hypothetical protein
MSLFMVRSNNKAMAMRSLLTIAMLSLLAALLSASPSLTFSQGPAQKPPYPASAVIDSITWHWQTHRTAAPGSDLWPVSWARDNHLYAAWGDGGGFDGTDQHGRVAMGFARVTVQGSRAERENELDKTEKK